MACLAYLSVLLVGAALPIEETDKEILYCNFEVPQEQLQAYLNPMLEPALYEGKAWVTAMMFELSSLKLVTPLGKVPLGGGSELFKLTRNVVRKDTGDKGYLLMNLDFPSGAQGWVQKMGCSATQPGVDCGASTSELQKSGTAHLSSYDGATFDVDFQVTSTPEDYGFLQYVINRPWKVLQQGVRGVVRAARQDGRAAGINYGAYRVEVKSLTSSVFATRWPSFKVDESSARCFWAEELLFEDHDAQRI